MSPYLLLALAAAVLALGRFGRGRDRRVGWLLGGLALVFLWVAGTYPQASLSGLYLALLAAGAMFGGDRGAWLYAGSCACAGVAGLTGELAVWVAAAAAGLGAAALVSRVRGLREARRLAERDGPEADGDAGEREAPPHDGRPEPYEGGGQGRYEGNDDGEERFM